MNPSVGEALALAAFKRRIRGLQRQMADALTGRPPESERMHLNHRPGYDDSDDEAEIAATNHRRAMEIAEQAKREEG